MTTPIGITLGGTALGSACPEFRVRDINRGLLAEPRDVAMDVPGRAGSWMFTEEPGDRMIRLEGMMLADGTAARRAAMRKLAAWARTDGTAQMVFADESDRYYEVILDSMPDVNEVLRYGEVELEFRTAPYPLATVASTHTEPAVGTPDSGTFNVTDDFPADPIIEITPTNGTITSLILTVNGAEISWTGVSALLSGETITISSLSDTVTLGVNVDVNLTGAFDPDDIDMANVAISGFPELVPGTNTWSLSWTGTATTVDIEFTWRERFI